MAHLLAALKGTCFSPISYLLVTEPGAGVPQDKESWRTLGRNVAACSQSQLSGSTDGT